MTLEERIDFLLDQKVLLVQPTVDHLIVYRWNKSLGNVLYSLIKQLNPGARVKLVNLMTWERLIRDRELFEDTVDEMGWIQAFDMGMSYDGKSLLLEYMFTDIEYDVNTIDYASTDASFYLNHNTLKWEWAEGWDGDHFKHFPTMPLGSITHFNPPGMEFVIGNCTRSLDTVNAKYMDSKFESIMGFPLPDTNRLVVKQP